MRRILTLLPLLVAMTACTTKAGPAPVAGASSPSIDRGRAYALRWCAGCHAIASQGASTEGMAPSFAIVRLRYNGVSLERRLADISANGHYEMPRMFLSSEEIHDLQDYIETVGRPAQAAPKR